MSLSLTLVSPQGALAPYRVSGQTLPAATGGGPFNRIAYSAAHVVADPRAAIDPWLQCAITENEIQAVFAEVNRIWAPAGIRFEVKGIREMQALNIPPKRFFQRSRNWVKEALPMDQLVSGVLNVCFIHDMGPNGFYYGEPAVVSEVTTSRRVRGGSDRKSVV